jgi:hypothetical protein
VKGTHNALRGETGERSLTRNAVATPIPNSSEIARQEIARLGGVARREKTRRTAEPDS